MFLTPTDPEEVLKIIKTFKPKKSSGHDGISMQFIKQIGAALATPLAFLINNFLSEGKFPDSMKIAEVIPIYKAKGKQHFTNYRPISLLPCFSKILEKVVHKRLYSFITKHNILYASQYGFRKKRSTLQPLFITRRLQDQAECTGDKLFMVFLDWEKAFDKVDQEKIIEALERLNIPTKIIAILKTF